MPFTPPTPDQIKVQFPQVDSIGNPKIGGFKAVFQARIGSNEEALKFVYIPIPQQLENRDEVRRESLGRVAREIDVLGRCKSPELVKLGSIPPSPVDFGGQDFVAYTEEFLTGHEVRDLITKQTRPSEQQIRSLVLSLLRAVRELWSMGIIHRDIKPGNVISLELVERPFVLLDRHDSHTKSAMP